MRFHANVWASCSEELAGPFDPGALPTAAVIRSVTFSPRAPSPWARLFAPLDDLLEPDDDAWQDHAEWLRR
jgi:hypothetical protein